MKINVFCFFYVLFKFALTANLLFGQSYTTLDDDGTETTYTSITVEQFNRIRNANEQNAVSVYVEFFDIVQATYPRVIRGTRPQFSGESYWIVEENPSNPNLEVFIRFRNGNKCFMNIYFFNRLFNNTISLVYNRTEYNRLYNLYTNMVRNAR
jgi:hypothetical protein